MNGISRVFLSRKGLLFVAITIMVALFFMPVSAAVKGNLTYTHGVNSSQKYTYASTQSTKAETDMYFYGYVNYVTGPNSGNTVRYQSPYHQNTSYEKYSVYPGSVQGSSLFEYFVGSSFVHTSTAWWDFDFR